MTADYMTVSEEAWKNGYEAGYARGVCDETARAMDGAVIWHEGVPKTDQHFCLVCVGAGAGRYCIRPAVFKAKYGVYLLESYTDDGSYYQERISANRVRYWAEANTPFSAKFSFSVPEAD